MSQKIIVYGNGASAKGFLLSQSNNFEILAFASDNPEAGEFEGYQNISTTDIKDLPFDGIIVASWAIHEIAGRLQNAGIARQKIRWFQHHKERILDWGHPDFNMSHQDHEAEEVLYCIYDLNVARATYDILGFLALCECERIKRGLNAIHIVIVSASNNDFNKSRWGLVNKDQHDWRVDQILVPCCSLLTHCHGVSKTASREEVSKLLQNIQQVFPVNYTEQTPVIEYEFDHLFERIRQGQKVAHLKANDEAKRFVQAALASLNPENKRVVSISLRESSNKPLRNSDRSQWLEFIAWLDKSIYFPILIPDTENAFLASSEELWGVTCLDAAAFNVQMRMALYELSYLNLGVNNGPTHLCALSESCRYIMYKQVVENYPHSSTQSFIDRGFEIGGNFPGATSLQKFVWEDDDFDVIAYHFSEMVDTIEVFEQQAVGGN